MIEHGLEYIVLLAVVASAIVLVEKKTEARFFEYLPSIVILYFTVMLLSTLGVWQKTPEITAISPNLAKR